MDNKTCPFFMAKMYSVLNTFYIFFIHSSVDGHLTWFLYFAHLKNSTVNLKVQMSLWDTNFLFFGYYYANPMLEIFNIMFWNTRERTQRTLCDFNISYYLYNHQKMLDRRQWTILYFQRATVSRMFRTENNEVIALKTALVNFWFMYFICLPNLIFSPLFHDLQRRGMASSSCPTSAVTVTICRTSAGTRFKFPMDINTKELLSQMAFPVLTSTALVLHKNSVGILRFTPTWALTLV